MASKIKVDTLETANGSGTIALSNQLSGMTTASLPTGSVLQVVSITSEATMTTTATGLVSSGVELSITPSSTSSKIMIISSISLSTSTGDSMPHTGLRRDSTDIGIASAAGSRSRSSGTGQIFDVNHALTISDNYLDSPSTTSAITYAITVGVRSGKTLKVNRTYSDGDSQLTNRPTSTLTLMEIKG